MLAARVAALFALPFLLAPATGIAQGRGGAAPDATGAAAEKRTTWAERLGYPAGKRVIVFHGDDIGMCCEANLAAQETLASGAMQSVSAMVPCPWFDAFAAWVADHPGHCVGLHLTLTSEWRHYRWGPVTPRAEVPGLVDRKGYLWRDVPHVMARAEAEEVEREIRAQVARARELGVEPTHLDTHMGTLYSLPSFAEAFLRVARELDIPALAVEPTPAVIRHFSRQGYVNRRVMQLLRDHPGPKLDLLLALPNGKTWEQKLARFQAQVQSLPPGLTELYFHPSVDSDALRRITNSWQQRVWEHRLFTDPAVRAWLAEQDLVLTSWREIGRRFRARRDGGGDPRERDGERR